MDWLVWSGNDAFTIGCNCETQLHHRVPWMDCYSLSCINTLDSSGLVTGSRDNTTAIRRKTTTWTSPVYLLNSHTTVQPASHFQTQTTSSVDPETMCFPSREKATDRISSSWPWKIFHSNFEGQLGDWPSQREIMSQQFGEYSSKTLGFFGVNGSVEI